MAASRKQPLKRPVNREHLQVALYAINEHFGQIVDAMKTLRNDGPVDSRELREVTRAIQHVLETRQE